MKKVLALLLTSLVLASSVCASNFAEEKDVNNVRYDVLKATAEWKGDGVWSEGEYYEIDVQDSWMSAACAKAEDLEATQFLDFTLAMSWDENYIYGYLNFIDENGHEQLNGDKPGNMWISGCLHIGAAEADGVDTNSLKYGIAVTSDTNQQIGVTWIDHLNSGYDPNTDTDYYVVNDNNELTYEWRTPISAFSEAAAAEGTQYGYCLSLGWGNDGSRQHTQIGAGCSGGPGEQASRFPKITLAAAPAVETVPEAASSETAPQTFDTGVIAAVSAVIAAAGLAASRKKH